jgi:mannose-6-phosphate isomerase-like protein (cupin superfamily)
MEKAKPFKVSSKDVKPGVAPLHEESNSWTLVLNEDIAMYITEIRPGGCAAKDMHPDADHVFYYTSGYGYQIIDGERFDFGPNDAIFVPRGCDHEMFVTGQETVRMIVTFSPLPADKRKFLEKK